VKWAQQLARTQHLGTGAVSFATEASMFASIGIPTVVLGPGSIAQAHKPDEYITYGQVAACEAFFARITEAAPPGGLKMADDDDPKRPPSWSGDRR
jgi:acetylornithine deacetylase/succinyl-diaminopimelate desuccinylase-like protein